MYTVEREEEREEEEINRKKEIKTKESINRTEDSEAEDGKEEEVEGGGGGERIRFALHAFYLHVLTDKPLCLYSQILMQCQLE